MVRHQDSGVWQQVRSQNSFHLIDWRQIKQSLKKANIEELYEEMVHMRDVRSIRICSSSSEG